MNTNQIFLGTIKKCTKYENHPPFSSETYIGEEPICCESFEYITEESKVVKENSVLIQVSKGGYVDLENYKTALDYFKIRQCIQKDGFRLGGLIMSTSPYCEGCLFVDSSTIRPLYKNDESKNISVYRLKKEINHHQVQTKM